jgi:hypothetical protein
MISKPLFFYTFAPKSQSMKKLIICILLLNLNHIHAQVSIGYLNKKAATSSTSFVWDRGSTNLYIDYSYLNNDSYGTRWNVNEYYTSSDSAINFSGVAYDNICGYYDYANYSSTVVSAADLGLSSIYPSNATLRFDSVQVEIAHENNSGIADTIIVELRELNANNTLSTTVLWTDSVITSVGLSPGNTWSNAQFSLLFLRFPIGYNTSAGQKAGIVFRYLNHNKLDTLGLIAAGIPTGFGSNSALQSSYKNSFLKFPPFAINTMRNSDFQMISGGYILAQNWIIIPRTEVYNTSLGLQSAKGDLEVLTVYPNPSNGLLNIAFKSEINSAINLSVTDVQGRLVKQIAINDFNADYFKEAIDCSQLNAGLYQLSIQQNNKVYTQRIVIGAN